MNRSDPVLAPKPRAARADPSLIGSEVLPGYQRTGGGNGFSKQPVSVYLRTKGKEVIRPPGPSATPPPCASTHRSIKLLISIRQLKSVQFSLY